MAALEISDARSVSSATCRGSPVRRDLAFVLPVEIPAGDALAALVDAGGPLLDRATLFDVFRGGAIAEDRKSLAFSLEFRAADRTLGPGGGADRRRDRGADALRLRRAAGLTVVQPGREVPLHSAAMRNYLSVDDLADPEVTEVLDRDRAQGGPQHARRCSPEGRSR